MPAKKNVVDSYDNDNAEVDTDADSESSFSSTKRTKRKKKDLHQMKKATMIAFQIQARNLFLKKKMVFAWMDSFQVKQKQIKVYHAQESCALKLKAKKRRIVAMQMKQTQ